MGKDKSSIQSKILRNMIFISLVSIGLWILILALGEYASFRAETEILRTQHLESQKKILKKEVGGAVAYINSMRKQAEEKLELSLKERVYGAHQTAMGIYHENSGVKPLFEIKKMIKDALRPVRFNSGRGYYFAVSMNGVQQLYPVRPELEGKSLIDLQDAKKAFVIQDEIEIIQKNGEGFVQHSWIKPGKNPSLMFPKISFVKYCKPLDWYLGAGEYLDDVERQTQAEVLVRLAALRFGEEGYFFGSTYQGEPLFSNGKITTGSENIWSLTDTNGVKIIQEQRKMVENPEGGFVYYSWNKLDTAAPSPKLSFVQGIPEWQWTIGSGVYLDTIEKKIYKNRQALNSGLKREIVRSLFTLAALLALVYFWSNRISKQIQKSVKQFSSFLVKASTDSVYINPNDIRFSEFKEIAISTNKMLMDRRQARKALQKSEEKYRGIFENAVEGFFQSTPKGRFISVNPAFAKMLGYESPESLISEITDIAAQFYVDHNDRDRYQQLLQKYGSVAQFEFKARCKNGSHIWVSTSTRVIYDKEGKILRYEGNVTNITARVQAEAEQKILSMAVQQSPVSIVITDSTGNIQYVNPKFCKLTGYSETEALGKNPRILQSGKMPKETYQHLWKTILDGREWHGEIQNKTKNGDLYWEDAIISPILNGKGEITHFLAVKEDITNRKKNEKLFQQSQRMESIGTLAGGIAHDFNNILFPIIGYTEMLLDDVPFDSPLRNSLDRIYSGALRARNLVRQILTFSQEGEKELKLMKIQPVVKEVLKLIRSIIPVTIDMQSDIRDECGMIKADPTQIHQIVMNLATNAFHSMGEARGELTVSLKGIGFRGDDIIEPDMRPGEYVCLTVSDTGKGMPKDVIEKIFDPFFTTKDKGKGTGMGLSVVHGIVKNMKGNIQVHSEPGKGSRFTVYFPVADSVPEKHSIQVPENSRTGTENILLIDDEVEIVRMEKHMLERLGYHVVSRISSIDALEAFRRAPDKFDLVITDMAMPNMSGEKLAVELIGIRPDIPILLCTGFSETLSEETAASLGIRGFLLKPVVMRDLSQKIREVLEEN
jgi:PAS domain S-box-containing protein